MNSRAVAIHPDVLQLLIAESQSAGMELNSYIRSLLPSRSTTAKSNVAVAPSGAVVELRHVTDEELEAVYAQFYAYAQNLSGPDEALVKGREAWARERAH